MSEVDVTTVEGGEDGGGEPSNAPSRVGFRRRRNLIVSTESKEEGGSAGLSKDGVVLGDVVLILNRLREDVNIDVEEIDGTKSRPAGNEGRSCSGDSEGSLLEEGIGIALEDELLRIEEGKELESRSETRDDRTTSVVVEGIEVQGDGESGEEER